MRIVIETIPHKEQRYKTCGDWRWFTEIGNTLLIRVSDMGDWRKEMAVAIHELVEALLCRQAGVDEATVDDFDKRYEDNRSYGDYSEAGDDPSSPYRDQHCIATAIERLLIPQFGLSWDEYVAAIVNL